MRYLKQWCHSLIIRATKRKSVFYGDSEGTIVNNNRTTKVDKDYKAKENKVMKKMNVPYTSVSVDPENERHAHIRRRSGNR